MSINAYRRTMREVDSPRQIERRLLATITGRIESYAAGYDSCDNIQQRLDMLATGLRSALSDNQRLWTTLKYDLAEPGNGLPADLRATLLSIALWMERACHTAMGGNGKLAPIVEVNNNIAEALTGASYRESA